MSNTQEQPKQQEASKEQNELELFQPLVNTRFLIPIQILPSLDDVKIEVLSIAAIIPAKTSQIKQASIIAAQLDLPHTEIATILKDEKFKSALKVVKSRIRTGCPQPADIAANAETEVLLDFTQRVLDPETTMADRIKLGEAILKYRAGLAKAAIPLAALTKEHDTSVIDKDTRERIHNRIKLKIVDSMVMDDEQKGSAGQAV